VCFLKTPQDLGLKYIPFVDTASYSYDEYKRLDIIETESINKMKYYAEATIGQPVINGVGGHGLFLLLGERGSGKTTVLYALKDYLKSRGVPCYYDNNINCLSEDIKIPDYLTQKKNKTANREKDTALETSGFHDGEVFLLLDVQDTLDEKEFLNFSKNLETFIMKRATIFLAINNPQKKAIEGSTGTQIFGKFHIYPMPKFALSQTREILESRLEPAHLKGFSHTHPFGESDIKYIQLSSDGIPRSIIKIASDLIYALLNDTPQSKRPRPEINLLDTRIQSENLKRQLIEIIDLLGDEENSKTFTELFEPFKGEVTESTFRRRLKILEENDIVTFVTTGKTGRTQCYYINSSVYDGKSATPLSV